MVLSFIYDVDPVAGITSPLSWRSGYHGQYFADGGLTGSASLSDTWIKICPRSSFVAAITKIIIGVSR
jgi:hypothetical protein